MNTQRWRKQHKWVGLLFSFFILMFCVSGIVLNHRTLFADYNISRKWLPEAYRFKNWNGGLLRGAICYNHSVPGSILLYGNSGIWQTDSTASTIKDFNTGLPEGADYRQIRSMASTPDDQLFACGQFNVFRFNPHKRVWEALPLATAQQERLTDMICHKDSLLVLGRSYLYLALPPYREFKQIALQAPQGYTGKVSLFRIVWLAHSGELLGIAGKILVDCIGIILIILCITGIIHWILPQYIRRKTINQQTRKRMAGLLKRNLSLHDKTGRYTLVLTLFLCITGWCLRPPVLLALVYSKVCPPPGSVLDSPNAWNDCLRMLRYDTRQNEWLLSASDGFYRMRELTDTPQPVHQAPPVSIMGVNVFEQNADGNWLIGSFSGLYEWNRTTGTRTDYFTGQPAPNKSGPPFGQHAIAGYSSLFTRPCIADYQQGSDFAPMPAFMEHLPVSLWNLALEIHNGRIYTALGPATIVYIFIAGILTVWCIYSGYKIRIKKRTRNSSQHFNN